MQTNVLKLSLPEDVPTKKPDVIYHPVSPESIDTMLELAAVTVRDTCYEMGCGDARLLIAAAKRFGCKCVGFEIVPELVEKARADAKAAGVEHLVEIVTQDMFTVDLRPASVVFLYILPHLNWRMVPQLLDMKSGARIVSCDFDIVRHIPDKVIQEYMPRENIYKMAFLYVAPLRRLVTSVKKQWRESCVVYDANDLSLLPHDMRFL